MDEANGNTLLASNPAAATSPGLIAAEPIATVVDSETLIIQSPSNDDLSQSLSEYTDADESISAPTELLAEVNPTNWYAFYRFIFYYQSIPVVPVGGDVA